MSHAGAIEQVLRDRSDDEILAWVHSVGGSYSTLAAAFLCMKEAFQAERAGDQSAVIRWQVMMPERQLVSYELEVTDGECSVSHGEQLDANVVLRLELADFLRLITGCLDGVAAYRSGKLTITGDIELATALSGWFRETH